MCPKSIPKNYSNERFLNTFLQGSEDFSFNTSEGILKANNKFLKKSECFNAPFFDHSKKCLSY